MVTVESVCASFGLNDVEIEYNGVENLTNYKSFTQCVRPILSKANPKVCSKSIVYVLRYYRDLLYPFSMKSGLKLS